MALSILKVSNRRWADPGPDRWERDFDPGCTYAITDDHPYLCLGIDQRINRSTQEETRKFLEELGENLGIWWYKWLPLSRDPSTERRFGLYTPHETLLAQIPSVRCYVWPERLYGRAEFLRILLDIERELGFPVVWGDDRSPVRAWATAEGAWAGASGERLLNAVSEREFPAATALLRGSAHVFDAAREPGREASASPERVLIAAWAARRAIHLQETLDGLRDTLGDFERRITDRSGNPLAQEDLRRAMEPCQARLARAVQLAGRLAGLRARHRMTAGVSHFTLSPAMQRDHRLRRLLSAFSPPPDERLAADEGPLSTLPPLKAPDLFELWGAVRIAMAFRALGWEGRPAVAGAPAHGQPGTALYVSWEFRRGDLRLILENAPRVDLAARPSPVSYRRISGLEEAAEFMAQDTLLSFKPCTPDYAIRLLGPAGAALSIGDASLADPTHQEGRKVTNITRYRTDIGWACPNGTPRRVHPLGLFLLLPGPPDRWNDSLHDEAACQDCMLLCPVPAGEDLVFNAQVGHLVEVLDQAVETRT